MRSTALRTASAPALSVLACRFSTYSPEKSGFTSAAKTWLRQRKGTWHYQTKLTVGGSLGFFNKLLGPTGREESTEGDYGGGQTGSFPFSEASSHYEPSESCEINIRKRPVLRFRTPTRPRRLRPQLRPRRGSRSGC